MPTESDHWVRDALAIAIVKERKRRDEEIEKWKARALEAEAAIEQWKSSVHQCNSVEAYLRGLDALEEGVTGYDSTPSTAISEAEKQRIALFLKNVHALRAIQAFQKQGRNDHTATATAFEVVSDFVQNSLLQLAPGKLRDAYAHHSAVFFTRILEAGPSDSGTFRDAETEVEKLITALLSRISSSSMMDMMEHHDSQHKETESHNETSTAIVEFLTCLLSNPFCLMTTLRCASESIVTNVRAVAQSARRLKDVHREALEAEHCEEFIHQSAVPCQAIQCLFVLQERVLERVVVILSQYPSLIGTCVEWTEQLVKNTMHAQQYVEILEIFCPDIAVSLYFSTAMVIAALQRVANEDTTTSEGILHRSKCLQLSKSIRDFYMPRPWT